MNMPPAKDHPSQVGKRDEYSVLAEFVAKATLYGVRKLVVEFNCPAVLVLMIQEVVPCEFHQGANLSTSRTYNTRGPGAAFMELVAGVIGPRSLYGIDSLPSTAKAPRHPYTGLWA